jgi:hypothetical protein
MSRTGWALLLLAAGEDLCGDEGHPARVLARGSWPHPATHSGPGIGTDRTPRTRVVRTQAELVQTAGGGPASP